MNVPTITMDRDEAQLRLEEYREGLRKKADEEWAAAVRGYEALAQGIPVIMLSHAFADVPMDEKKRPRLAIARADRKEVEFSWNGNRLRFDSCSRRRRFADSDFRLDVPTSEPAPHWGNRRSGYAMVPMVPPGVLNKAKSLKGGTRDLRRLFVLWEVEEWADAPLRVIPDRDPLLLRPLHPGQYEAFAVYGEWDLTELERAVMRGRTAT